MHIRMGSSCVIGFLVLLLFHTPAHGADRTVYKIATTAWAGWSALNVADVKGFWKEEGVTVELVHYYGAPVLVDVIMAGKVDLNVNMVGDVVDMQLKGSDMTILAELDWSHGGDQMILKKGVNLHEQLGKPVGIHYNSPAIWYFMQRYLENEGLDFSNFRLVEMGPDDLVNQFTAGRFFMIQHYSPYALSAAQKGNGVVAATSADYPGVIPECVYGLKSHLMKIPRGDLKKILRGIVRGADWLNNPDNLKAYKEILNRETFKDHPDYNDAELSTIIGQVRIHTSERLLEANRDGGNLAGHLTVLRDFLKKHGKLTRDFSVGDIFDNSLILEVLGNPPAHRP